MEYRESVQQSNKQREQSISSPYAGVSANHLLQKRDASVITARTTCDVLAGEASTTESLSQSCAVRSEADWEEQIRAEAFTENFKQECAQESSLPGHSRPLPSGVYSVVLVHKGSVDKRAQQTESSHRIDVLMSDCTEH